MINFWLFVIRIAGLIDRVFKQIHALSYSGPSEPRMRYLIALSYLIYCFPPKELMNLKWIISQKTVSDRAPSAGFVGVVFENFEEFFAFCVRMAILLSFFLRTLPI